MCGFEQRLQRPAFVRKTKHSGVGHEDVGYSYVVIRRGTRPSAPRDIEVGRLGQVGKEELAKSSGKKLQRELTESDEPVADVHEATEPVVVVETKPEMEAQSSEALDGALRSESNNWPRLVFPPMKRSGHVILDCCTPAGTPLHVVSCCF